MGSQRCRVVLTTVLGVALALLASVCRAEVNPRLLLVAAVAAKEKALDSGRMQDWERTLELFRQSHAENATAATAYEMGIAATHLEREDIAFEAYEEAVGLGLRGDTLLKAQRFIVDHVARLSRLYLTCPEGSRVFIRGIARGRTPLGRPLVVLPGAADIECRTTDNELLRGNVVLREGRQHVASLDRPSLPERAAPRRERLLFEQRDATATHPSAAGHGQAQPKGVIVEASRTTSTRRTAWTLVGAGSSLAVLGTVYAVIASSQMAEGVSALAGACAEQVDGPDSCKHAKPGQQAAAQSHSDSIATWRTARSVSYASAGLGLAAILGGVAMFVGATQTTSVATSMPEIQLTPQQFSLHFRRRF